MILKEMMASAIILIFLFSFKMEGTNYQVAFYSDFEPISYSESRDPSSPEFHHPAGYEVDLLKAIQAIPGSDMTFVFHGVKEWNNIWLTPYTDPKIDIAIGGISREDKRLLNKEGKQVVANTHQTTQFKQSILINAKDLVHIKTHADLTCAYTIGAVRGTTGEYRYLAQTNIMDGLDKGLIRKGVTVVLDDRSVLTSDGFLSIYDPKIDSRTMLIPSDCTLPITKYFVAEDSMIPALKEGYIDAIARGYIGNKLVADRSDGKFVVSAIYSLECPKEESVICSKKEAAVFFVKVENQELLDKLDRYMDYLTDGGKIDYEVWTTNKHVFMDRAKDYPKRS